jgi:hypothetical protein
MVGHVNKIMWVRMRWSNDPPKCAFVLYGEGYGTAVDCCWEWAFLFNGFVQIACKIEISSLSSKFILIDSVELIKLDKIAIII